MNRPAFFATGERANDARFGLGQPIEPRLDELAERPCCPDGEVDVLPVVACLAREQLVVEGA